MGSILQRTHTPALLPPRCVFHGRGGVGKTTLALSARGAIVQSLEEGEGVLDATVLPPAEAYADVLNALEELRTEDHAFKTYIMDTIDRFEPLVWAHVCQEHGKAHIESFGYGKGYTLADTQWVAFFDALDALRRERGMTVVILAHSEARNIDDPVQGPYSRWTPKLHKRANALLFEWADVMGYLEVERLVLKDDAKDKVGRASATGQRVLYLEDTGGYEAKNRYDLPPQIEIPKTQPFEAIRAPISAALAAVAKRRKSTTTMEDSA
jgi:hypothetical protein